MVGELEETIKQTAVTVAEAKVEAQEQAAIVGKEKEIVDVEAEFADVKSAEANKVATEVNAKKQSVQKDLDEAIPLVEKAEAALKGLKEDDFKQLKALTNPPEMIKITFTAVLHLYSTIDPLITCDKKGKLKEEKPWNTALKMMAKPKDFLAQLNGFKELIDNDKVPTQNFEAIKETLAMENFTPDVLQKASAAARGVCDWIINIESYFRVVVSVEPKKQAVRDAEVQLAEAMATKQLYEDRVAELQAKLKGLIDKLDAALAKKRDAEETAAKCEKKLGLATRLVNALGAEGERWSASIIQS